MVHCINSVRVYIILILSAAGVAALSDNGFRAK